MTIYLYVKTHRITGLKYLGKTIKNPFKYRGSGLDWNNHLKKYGCDVETEVLKECVSYEELGYWGRYYSSLWKIVTSQDDYGNKIWANKIPETGGGPGRSGYHQGKHNPMYGKNRDDLKGPSSPNKHESRRTDSRKLMLNRWNDPNYKNKRKAELKNLWNDPEYLTKMKNRPRTNKKISVEGVIYDSLKSAAHNLGLDPSTVSKRCSSTDEKFINWVYL